MLKVSVGTQLAGSLFKPESESQKFHFAYLESCPAESAVSLTMPVVNEKAPVAVSSGTRSGGRM